MGRPPKNDLEMDWKSRLELFWERYPSYRRAPAALCETMRAIDSVETPEIDDFRLKLDGRRPSNERFGRVLFEAIKASHFGLTLSAFLGSADAWQAEVEGLEGSDLKALFEANLTGENFRVEVRKRLPPGARSLRRISKQVVKTKLPIGSDIQIVCMHVGSEVLLSAHLLVLELERETGEWQVFNALEGSGVNHNKPVTFELKGTDRLATVDIVYPVSGPANIFDTYVIASNKPFDHRITALLNSGDLPDTGLLSPKHTTDLRILLSANLTSYLIGSCEYQVI